MTLCTNTARYLRLYLASVFTYIEATVNEDGIRGVNKFLERVQRLVTRVIGTEGGAGKADPDLNYQLNYAIKHVAEDIPQFSFNTAVARIMELVNAMYKYMDGGPDGVFAREAAQKLLLLLAPFAPHSAEIGGIVLRIFYIQPRFSRVRRGRAEKSRSKYGGHNKRKGARKV
jgi:leucyl-tRNA synthetase